MAMAAHALAKLVNGSRLGVATIAFDILFIDPDRTTPGV